MGTHPPMLYRCACGNLLRRSDISKGVCLGHKVQFATTGNFFDWIKTIYWKLTGGLS